MTGLDVLRRCAAYETEMARLRQQHALAMDAATRVSPSLDRDGGRSSEVSSKAERFAVKADWLERRMIARRWLYAQELDEAARLLPQLEIAAAEAIRLVMISGQTVRQTAGEMRRSEDAVRALLRRGRLQLAALSSALDQDPEYAEQMRVWKSQRAPGLE